MRTYHGIELPEQDNIEVALRLAREKLTQVDAAEVADRLQCDLVDIDGKPGLGLSFLGAPITMTLPEGEANYAGGSPVPDFLLVLVLHYLTARGGRPLGDPISFVQVPSGAFYEDAFNRRTKKSLLETFGDDVGLFSRVANELGWKPGDRGDAEATALPLPCAPVTFVFYGRDEEFEPDVNILFDASIPDLLPTEDIAMMCGILVGSACKTAVKHRQGESL